MHHAQKGKYYQACGKIVFTKGWSGLRHDIGLKSELLSIVVILTTAAGNPQKVNS